MARRAPGKTFDTLCPVDNSVLAKVAAGDAADIDAAAKAAAAAFPAWRAVPGAKRRAILHAIADAIVARAEEIALVESIDTGQPIRYMAKAALRGAENFRFFADRAPGAGDGLSLPDTRPPQLHDAPAHRPGRHHHAVEHAVHAVDLEDRAGAGGRLHGRAQAGRVEPAHRRRCSTEIMDGVIRKHGLPAGVVNMVHGLGEDGRQGADRASADQGRSASSATARPAR